MKPLQIIVLVFFGLLAVSGVFFFALYKGGSSAQSLGKVVIWGTLPNNLMQTLLSDLSNKSDAYKTISYVEIPESSFSDEYIQALAEDRGPDLIVLQQDNLHERMPTLRIIPYSSLSERDFRDTYVEGAEIFLTSSGIAGIPFTIDPLVTYWNRSILQANGEAKPPQLWGEYIQLASKLTEKDVNLKISRSTVALGEFSNVTHAKEIYASMLLQAGTPIVGVNSQGRAVSLLNNKLKDQATVPADDVLRYLTQFSDPRKSVYSWNRGLPTSLQAFISNDLAFYFGYASEVKSIREANPNLNYDVTHFPQTGNTVSKAVFANMTALAIPRGSKNPGGAFQAALALTSSNSLRLITSSTGLPPVRRDLLSEKVEDPYISLFYQAALIGKAWRDPNPSGSATIFKNMTEAVTTGRMSIGEAVSAASQQLNVLLQ